MSDIRDLKRVGGELCLDFANTAGGRETPPPIEHLAGFADLLDWAEQAGAVSSTTAAQVAEEPGGGADALFDRAIALREAIHRAGARLAHCGEPAAADLAVVSETAASALASARLARSSSDRGFSPDFSDAPAAAVLGPIALSALALLERGGFDRLKQCPAEDCGWLFLDRSKNGSRRWCDMATCGNRVKVRRARGRGSA